MPRVRNQTNPAMKTIRQQLSGLLLTVTCVVVVVAAAAFFFVEIFVSRDAAVNHLLPLAEMIGISVKPALVLKNPYRAGELLDTLAPDENIRAAYLFNQLDQPFAFYKPAQKMRLALFSKEPEALFTRQEVQAFLASGEKQVLFRGDYLAVFSPIYEQRRKLGTVYLVTHLSRLQQQLFFWLVCAVPISGLALGLGVLISGRLQQAIVAPVSRLVAKMQQVSSARDYSLHTEESPSSEIAALIAGFNAMLGRISTHEQELETINASLERRIAERTEELQHSLQEKEFLLKEIHHRVKNNLQIVASLLSLQIKKVHDQSAMTALQASLTRIRSIALIHEKLYTRGHATTTDLGEYLALLAQEVFRLQNLAPDRVSLEISVGSVGVDIDTLMNLSLVLNELLTNALKYAFPDERCGVVTVRLTADSAGELTLSVEDDGIGLPADFTLRKTASLGLRLAENMLLQRGGSLIVFSRERGTSAVVRCPAAVTAQALSTGEEGALA